MHLSDHEFHKNRIKKRILQIPVTVLLVLVLAIGGMMVLPLTDSKADSNASSEGSAVSEGELLSVSDAEFIDSDTESSTEIAVVEDGRNIIESFQLFDVASNYLYVNADNKPTLEALLQLMPKYVYVTLKGVDYAIQLPCSWQADTTDYEDTELYYYQFEPVFDDTKFMLASEDLMENSPYIGVFLGDYVTPTVSMTGLTAASAGTGATGTVAVTAEKQAIYNFLLEQGFPKSAACGIMANIMAESGCRSNNLEQRGEKKLGYTDESYTTAVDNGTYTNFGHDYVGYGICQWTSDGRKQNLLKKAKSENVSISNLHMQLEFLMSELSTKDINYYKSLPETDQGAYDAAYYFCVHFEQPSNMEANGRIRGNLARNFFWPTFANGTITGCSHSYTSVTITQANCQHGGEVRSTCIYCGDSYTTTTHVDSNVHTNTAIRNASAATATSDGYTGDVYCKDCGKLVSKGTTIPAGSSGKKSDSNTGSNGDNSGTTGTGGSSDTGGTSETGDNAGNGGSTDTNDNTGSGGNTDSGGSTGTGGTTGNGGTESGGSTDGSDSTGTGGNSDGSGSTGGTTGSDSSTGTGGNSSSDGT